MRTSTRRVSGHDGGENHDGLPDPSMRDSALKVLKECLSNEGWSISRQHSDRNVGGARSRSVSPARDFFTMVAMTGGMSNATYRCDCPTANPSTVLLRCYGDSSLLDREKEISVATALSDAGLAPKLLGLFANGRLEEYLPIETLKAFDLRVPQTSAAIARSTAAMHKLKVASLAREPQVFVTMRRWYSMAVDVAGDSGYDRFDLAALAQAIDKLQDRLSTVYSPVVLCHNDLQYGNVMGVREIDTVSGGADGGMKNLRLIDFEYSCFNPRGFDLGNHFCEWMANYHSDTPHNINFRLFPTSEEQRLFCEAYLEAAGDGLAPVGDIAVDALVREAREYSLASHLLWAAWGLVQFRVSKIDFDYLEYAKQRFQAFEYFSAAWTMSF